MGQHPGRLGLNVIAGQPDMLPAERGDMRHQIVGNRRGLGALLPDGSVEKDYVPVHDCGRDEAHLIALNESTRGFEITRKLDNHRRMESGNRQTAGARRAQVKAITGVCVETIVWWQVADGGA